MDLNILTLARRDGKDEPEPPGLYIASQPRRPARGRGPDRLIFYLVFTGNVPVPPDQRDQLLKRLAQLYYKTPGSSTAAQRAVAELLNQQLLERNLRSASRGLQSVAMLTIITVRGDRVYLAQCGPMQTYLISSQEVQHFYDPQSSSRGLGLGRTTPIYYSQASLEPGNVLIVSPQPPPAWNKYLLGSLQGQALDQLRQRLLGQAGANLDAFLIHTKSGPGKVFLLRPRPSAGLAQPELPDIQPAASPVGGTPQSDVIQLGPPKAVEVSPPPEELASYSPSEPGFVEPVSPVQPETHGFAAPAAAAGSAARPARKPAPRRRSFSLAPVFGVFAAVGRALGNTSSQIGRSFRSFLGQVLPGESLLTLPSSLMAFFAIVVPLVVVTIASVVYFQRGRADQHMVYYAQAAQIAGYARQQVDLQAQREAWQAVVTYLDQANQYGESADSQTLRTEANQVIDNLDAIARLDFQPAIVGGLPDTLNVTRLVATESELYLLDGQEGKAWRTFFTGRGYELDNSFQCGPGTPVSQVGKLIDIAAAPLGNDSRATLLAIDAKGNLLQCIPGEQPVLVSLAPPPSSWGKPTAMTMDLGNMYILDPEKNAVWIYWNGSYAEQPQLFFTEAIPPLKDVLEIAVDGDDLYLLHEDGHLTLCTFSGMGVAPTRCTDPAPYLDSRPGRENQVMSVGAPFTQILATRPPDPSLYLLEPQSQSIYHFSLRFLTYDRQYRPAEGFNSGGQASATAFSLNPDARFAFLALANKVYYAGLR